jgi:hypothetical protein
MHKLLMIALIFTAIVIDILGIIKYNFCCNTLL